MGIPVKVSSELIEEAKQVAKLANRSVTKQIEHWAELGRAVEHLAPMSDLVALKARHEDQADARKNAQAHAVLERLAVALADDRDRSAALKLIHDTGMPVYGAVPGREDRILQVWPDGRRVVGRIVNQEFVTDEPFAE